MVWPAKSNDQKNWTLHHHFLIQLATILQKRVTYITVDWAKTRQSRKPTNYPRERVVAPAPNFSPNAEPELPGWSPSRTSSASPSSSSSECYIYITEQNTPRKKISLSLSTPPDLGITPQQRERERVSFPLGSRAPSDRLRPTKRESALLILIHLFGSRDERPKKYNTTQFLATNLSSRLSNKRSHRRPNT